MTRTHYAIAQMGLHKEPDSDPLFSVPEGGT